MIPINLIQAIFKSGALQKLHSLSNTNQGEHKTQIPSTTLSSLLPTNKSEITENAILQNPLHQTDTVELTSNDSNQFLQQQITFQTQNFGNFSLRMSGRKKNGKIDPAFCRLLFSLDPNNLNEVVIDVKVQNRILSIVIFNETEGIESLVHEFKSTLQTNLESLGYQLSSVKIGKPTTSDEQIRQIDLTIFRERVDIKI